MAEPAQSPPSQPEPEAPSAPASFRARVALMRRLADVVCLPSSRVDRFERAMTGDLLVEMLRAAAPAERARLAARLAPLGDIPSALLRVLLADEVEVAAPLLEAAAVNDSELLACARAAEVEHRLIIARRRPLSEVVADALVEAGEARVLEALLRNNEARLSQYAMEGLAAASRSHRALCADILRRPELRPAQAYAMFWWADADCRRQILTRFAVSRTVLQEVAADVFQLAADEGWSDPMVRKALHFVERRQRSRAALARSAFDSLEAAVAAAAERLTPELVTEIALLAGLKPLIAAKILADPGGEPIAVLCKAAGLPRAALLDLWRGLRRPEADLAGVPAEALERCRTTYDMLATDRAQTVLRYWNWSLSLSITPALMQAIREEDEAATDALSPPERAAMLASGSEFE